MGKDLNFDELDQAVNSYMKTGSGPTPLSSNLHQPTVSAQGDSPAPVRPDFNPVASPAAGSIHVPKPDVRPLIQVRSRQNIAANARSTSSTFHDVMPARRPSPTNTTKQLHPVNDSPSLPPAKLTLPEETPEVKTSTPVLPVAPAVPEVKAPPSPIAPSFGESSHPAEDHVPKILGETQKESTEIPEASPSSADTTASKPLSIELEEPATIDSSTDDNLLVKETANKGMSDALLEDLRKESAAVQANSNDEVIRDDAPASTYTPTPEVKKPGLLSGTPIELQDHKIDEDTPPKLGLMDTGELHTASSPVDTSHMLDAGNDDEQSMKVFDTKEYHPPITSHEQAPARSKVWEIVIVLLVVAIVAAAGFVAYMMAFSGN